MSQDTRAVGSSRLKIGTVRHRVAAAGQTPASGLPASSLMRASCCARPSLLGDPHPAPRQLCRKANSLQRRSKRPSRNSSLPASPARPRQLWGAMTAERIGSLLSDGGDPDIIKSANDRKEYRRFSLPNGLTVLLISDPEVI